MSDCSAFLAQKYARTGGKKNSPQEVVPKLRSIFFFSRKTNFPGRHVSCPKYLLGFGAVLAAGLTELLVWLSKDIFWILMKSSLATKLEISDAYVGLIIS